MSVSKVDENRYRIFISDGYNLDGSRRRFTKTIATDLKGRDLERFLTLAEYDFEDEVKKKDPKFQSLARGTFEAYSEWWLEHKSIAPKTLQNYQLFLNARILPFIGNKILDKITNGDMLELIKEIENSPAKTESGKLSPKSVKHHHTLLKNMFNDAVKFRIINESPMEHVTVKTPRVQLRDNYYDIKDINKLLDVLPKAPVKYQLAVLVALTTGMRVGEITALQWKHIDYDKLEIKVEQSNSYTKESGSFIKSTKTESSERVVAFPRFLLDVINKHKEEELIKKEYLGKDWYFKDRDHLDDFVFTQEDGDVMFVGTPSSWFRKFLKRNNLKHITFHGLRHTNTTILINEGINIVSISHSLGHSKTSTTTDYYAHHLHSVEREMANTFDDILKNGTEIGTKEGKLKIIK